MVDGMADGYFRPTVSAIFHRIGERKFNPATAQERERSYKYNQQRGLMAGVSNASSDAFHLGQEYAFLRSGPTPLFRAFTCSLDDDHNLVYRFVENQLVMNQHRGSFSSDDLIPAPPEGVGADILLLSSRVPLRSRMALPSDAPFRMVMVERSADDRMRPSLEKALDRYEADLAFAPPPCESYDLGVLEIRESLARFFARLMNDGRESQLKRYAYPTIEDVPQIEHVGDTDLLSRLRKAAMGK